MSTSRFTTKQPTKPFLLISLILSLLLTGCSLISKPFEEVITDWKPNVAYYGSDRVFQVVSQPDYVKESIVYQVDDDRELALLAKILFDQGVTQFYLQDKEFNISKVYAYLDALMIHAFKFSMGTKTYSSGQEVVKTLDYVKIELYRDALSDVDGAIQDFLDSKVNTSDPLRTQLKAIHDGLIISTQYDTSVLDLDLSNIADHTPFEAYGLFIDHKAVCSGYAKAFMGLAQALEVPALTVSSTVMNHAWNMVYDGSVWLYVDVTWDDPVPDRAGKAQQNYFLIDLKTITTDSKTIKAHVFDQTTESTLSAQDYLDFALYLFPSTQP